MSDWFTDDKATFGDRLAAAREAAGLSQDDLARRLGVTAKTVRGWEEDRAEPRTNRLQILAGLVNVSLKWLMTGTGEGVPVPADEAASPQELQALMDDVRVIRAETGRMAERLGAMERRLKRLSRGEAA